MVGSGDVSVVDGTWKGPEHGVCAAVNDVYCGLLVLEPAVARLWSCYEQGCVAAAETRGADHVQSTQ